MYYPPSSQTLREVQLILPPMMRNTAAVPSAQGSVIDLPPPPPPPPSPLVQRAGPVTGGSTQVGGELPLGSPPGQMGHEQLLLFNSLIQSMVKGPMLSGLPAFLQAHVPAGQISSPPSPLLEKEKGKKVPEKKKHSSSSSHKKGKSDPKVSSRGKSHSHSKSKSSHSEKKDLEEGEPSSKRHKTHHRPLVGSSVTIEGQSVEPVLPLSPGLAGDRGTIEKRPSRSGRSLPFSSVLAPPSLEGSMEGRGEVSGTNRGLVQGPLGMLPQPTGGIPSLASGLFRDNHDGHHDRPLLGVDRGRLQSSGLGLLAHHPQSAHFVGGARSAGGPQSAHSVGGARSTGGGLAAVGLTRTNTAVAPPFPREHSPHGSRSGARSIQRGAGSPHPSSVRSRESSLDRTHDRDEEEEATGQQVASIDDRSSDAGRKDSVFRWALSSVAQRMGYALPEPGVAVGSGAFAVAPPQSFISLPVSASIVKTMDGINHNLAKKVETGRSDGFFPSLAVTSDAQRTYASHPTGPFDLTCAAPTEDPLLALLRRQDKTVWSAYVKKARLMQWQNAAHHMTGRLSMMDSMTLFIQDLVNESSMIANERDQLLGAVSVMQSALRGTGTMSTHLSAHLDLTVRDAELRQLDLTPFQLSQFRSSPLFRERLFGITRADVEEITSSRMVSDIHSLASKGGPKTSSSTAPKQGKKRPSKGAAQPSRVVQPFPGQAAVPHVGQQPAGQKRGGGRKGQKRGQARKR